MLIETRAAIDAEVAALVVAQQQELRDAARGRGEPVMVVRDGAAYLVAVLDGRAAACGAWQPLEPGIAELKRLYVRPAYRGRGIGRHLVVALEEEALVAGYPVLRVETGSYLPPAISWYRSMGYAPIPVYGEYLGNPFSACFEKRLPVPA